MMMEAAGCCELLILLSHITQHSIPEDFNFSLFPSSFSRSYIHVIQIQVLILYIIKVLITFFWLTNHSYFHWKVPN
jgi:hypothetical protein